MKMTMPDNVRLSAQERQELANIERLLGSEDPALARALRSGPVHARGQVAGSGLGPVAKCASTGPLLVLAGLALMLAALPTSFWLGLLGEIVTGTGVWLWAVTAGRRRVARTSNH